jgi:hypothetical protein
MKSARYLALVPMCLVVAAVGCNEETKDEPLESAEISLPVETAAAAEPASSGFSLEAQPAPEPVASSPASASASATTKKPAGPAFSLAKCCAALHSNAKSAPLEQKGTYAMAAGACDASKNDPQALYRIRSMTMAAGVPAACS